jgi:hypothetical protein
MGAEDAAGVAESEDDDELMDHELMELINGEKGSSDGDDGDSDKECKAAGVPTQQQGGFCGTRFYGIRNVC